LDLVLEFGFRKIIVEKTMGGEVEVPLNPNKSLILEKKVTKHD
jgi:hypothetical protein